MPTTGFELGTSGIGSSLNASCATTTDFNVKMYFSCYLMCLILCQGSFGRQNGDFYGEIVFVILTNGQTC